MIPRWLPWTVAAVLSIYLIALVIGGIWLPGPPVILYLVVGALIGVSLIADAGVRRTPAVPSGPADCTCGSRATVIPIESLTGEIIDHRCPACWLPRKPPPRPPAGSGGGSPITHPAEASSHTPLIAGVGTREDPYLLNFPPCTHPEHTEVRAFAGTRLRFCAVCGTLDPATVVRITPT